MCSQPISTTVCIYSTKPTHRTDQEHEIIGWVVSIGVTVSSEISLFPAFLCRRFEDSLTPTVDYRIYVADCHPFLVVMSDKSFDGKFRRFFVNLDDLVPALGQVLVLLFEELFDN